MRLAIRNNKIVCAETGEEVEGILDWQVEFYSSTMILHATITVEETHQGLPPSEPSEPSEYDDLFNMVEKKRPFENRLQTRRGPIIAGIGIGNGEPIINSITSFGLGNGLNEQRMFMLSWHDPPRRHINDSIVIFDCPRCGFGSYPHDCPYGAD